MERMTFMRAKAADLEFPGVGGFLIARHPARWDSHDPAFSARLFSHESACGGSAHVYNLVLVDIRTSCLGEMSCLLACSHRIQYWERIILQRARGVVAGLNEGRDDEI